MNDKLMAFERLMAIKEEMDELIQEVEHTVRTVFPYDYENARSYWIAHIKSALGGHGYHTYSTTFESALEIYEEEAYEDAE